MSPAARRPLLRLTISHPVLVVWCCYVMLIPVYVVPSGYPQPSDFLIVFLVPMAVATWDGRLDRTTLRTLRPLLLFTLWVCVVSLAWALILWSWGRNLLYPLYYLYDTAFFIAALLLYRRFGDSFLRLTVNLVLASVAIQVCAAAFFGGGARGHLFFHNPNQLGYYAMLAGCMIALGQRRLGIRMLTASLGLAGCAVLAMLSASRAAVGGVGFLFMLLVFANPRVLIVAAIVAAALSVVESPVDDSVDTLEWRIEHPRMAQDSFWQQRGYDRIANNSRYAVLGAAEGNFWRFKDTTALGEAEIHSSAGTLLFCYGIPGVALCLLFLFQLVRGVRIQTAAMLMPVLMYSVAHQGLRFTMLWVMLGLYAALKNPIRKPTPARATALVPS